MDDQYTTINCLSQHQGKEVTLAGWLYKGRSSGKVQFLVLRDGTGLCQCVVEKSKVPGELFEQLKHLGQESSLTVTGTVRDRDSMEQIRISTDQLLNHLREKLDI